MLPVGIFRDDLFTFPVSNLTFPHYWFMRDGNVVFFSVMIFFNTTFFVLLH